MIASRIALALRPNENGIHDLALTDDGHLDLVYDAEAIGQHARQRTMTFSGEWFIDTTCGVPWLEQILGRQFDAALAESVIKKELVETDGVTGIEAFSLSYSRTVRGINVTRATLATVYEEEASV
ncbi:MULTISPECIES: hypothetical protein [unclassified Aurantimonas]|uniref:hypothetical protein n=1 Tax=unclassified Aurantimonas TaxID=2638230 RepID=UPI002E189F46|nr:MULTISPECIES: hypothetical protein [unclassified Aurantimonas]MEC5289369.1 hypothetical protein [Aurantimonas sp. C2-3-R2]MEC5410449.1 hypothetical protein [Aurantimonas sp. C2-4-R8]